MCRFILLACSVATGHSAFCCWWADVPDKNQWCSHCGNSDADATAEWSTGDAVWCDSSPPTTQRPTPNPEDVITIRPNGNPDYCLDLPGGDTSTGNTLWLWHCDGSQNQNWIIPPIGPSDYGHQEIRFAADPSKCIRANKQHGAFLELADCDGFKFHKIAHTFSFGAWDPPFDRLCMDVPGNDVHDAAYLWMWECNGGDNQLFTAHTSASPTTTRPTQPPNPADMITIRPNGNPDYCLDLSGWDTSAGNTLWLWHCNGSQNQNWIIPSIGHPDTQPNQVRFAADPSKCLIQTNIQKGASLQLADCIHWGGFPFSYYENEHTFRFGTFDKSLWVDQDWCMDVPGNDFHDGAFLWIWDCNGENNQMFTAHTLQTWEAV